MHIQLHIYIYIYTYIHITNTMICVWIPWGYTFYWGCWNPIIKTPTGFDQRQGQQNWFWLPTEHELDGNFWWVSWNMIQILTDILAESSKTSMKNSFFWKSFMSKPLPNIGCWVLFFSGCFLVLKILKPIAYLTWLSQLASAFVCLVLFGCLKSLFPCRDNRDPGRQKVPGTGEVDSFRFFLPNGVFQRCFKLRKCILVFFTSWICPNVQVNI